MAESAGRWVALVGGGTAALKIRHREAFIIAKAIRWCARRVPMAGPDGLAAATLTGTWGERAQA